MDHIHFCIKASAVTTSESFVHRSLIQASQDAFGSQLLRVGLNALRNIYITLHTLRVLRVLLITQCSSLAILNFSMIVPLDTCFLSQR